MLLRSLICFGVIITFVSLCWLCYIEVQATHDTATRHGIKTHSILLSECEIDPNNDGKLVYSSCSLISNDLLTSSMFTDELGLPAVAVVGAIFLDEQVQTLSLNEGDAIGSISSSTVINVEGKDEIVKIHYSYDSEPKNILDQKLYDPRILRVLLKSVFGGNDEAMRSKFKITPQPFFSGVKRYWVGGDVELGPSRKSDSAPRPLNTFMVPIQKIREVLVSRKPTLASGLGVHNLESGLSHLILNGFPSMMKTQDNQILNEMGFPLTTSTGEHRCKNLSLNTLNVLWKNLPFFFVGSSGLLSPGMLRNDILSSKVLLTMPASSDTSNNLNPTACGSAVDIQSRRHQFINNFMISKETLLLPVSELQRKRRIEVTGQLTLTDDVQQQSILTSPNTLEELLKVEGYSDGHKSNLKTLRRFCALDADLVSKSDIELRSLQCLSMKNETCPTPPFGKLFDPQISYALSEKINSRKYEALATQASSQEKKNNADKSQLNNNDLELKNLLKDEKYNNKYNQIRLYLSNGANVEDKAESQNPTFSKRIIDNMTIKKNILGISSDVEESISLLTSYYGSYNYLKTVGTAAISLDEAAALNEMSTKWTPLTVLLDEDYHPDILRDEIVKVRGHLIKFVDGLLDSRKWLESAIIKAIHEHIGDAAEDPKPHIESIKTKIINLYGRIGILPVDPDDWEMFKSKVDAFVQVSGSSTVWQDFLDQRKLIVSMQSAEYSGLLSKTKRGQSTIMMFSDGGDTTSTMHSTSHETSSLSLSDQKEQVTKTDADKKALEILDSLNLINEAVKDAVQHSQSDDEEAHAKRRRLMMSRTSSSTTLNTLSHNPPVWSSNNFDIVTSENLQDMNVELDILQASSTMTVDKENFDAFPSSFSRAAIQANLLLGPEGVSALNNLVHDIIYLSNSELFRNIMKKRGFTSPESLVEIQMRIQPLTISNLLDAFRNTENCFDMRKKDVAKSIFNLIESFLIDIPNDSVPLKSSVSQTSYKDKDLTGKSADSSSNQPEQYLPIDLDSADTFSYLKQLQKSDPNDGVDGSSDIFMFAETNSGVIDSRLTITKEATPTVYGWFSKKAISFERNSIHIRKGSVMNPAIGDTKLSFYINKESEVSFLARQKDGSLEPWQEGFSYPVFSMLEGRRSFEDVVNELFDHLPNTDAFIIGRILTVLFIWAGICLCLLPLYFKIKKVKHVIKEQSLLAISLPEQNDDFQAHNADSLITNQKIPTTERQHKIPKIIIKWIGDASAFSVVFISLLLDGFVCLLIAGIPRALFDPLIGIPLIVCSLLCFVLACFVGRKKGLSHLLTTAESERRERDQKIEELEFEEAELRNRHQKSHEEE